MAEHKLHDIITLQKQGLALLEAETKALDASDLAVENKKLMAEAEQQKEQAAAMLQRLEKLEQQNKQLREAVYTQAYESRESILTRSKQEADLLFERRLQNEETTLRAWEQSMRQQMAEATMRLKNLTEQEGGLLHRELEDISARAEELTKRIRAQIAVEKGAFSNNQQRQMQELRDEHLTDEQVTQVANKHNWERFIGLNLINKLGLLLIVIGVIVAAQYTYLKLDNTLKGALMFLLGGVMLALGELLSRRKANVFSLGVTAGGVAVLYVALSISYFFLGILGTYAALGLCVLITVATFLLSLRYNAQVILAFALVGGYLPLFSLGGSVAMLYGSMVYLVILNLLALAVSFHKKWTITSCVGLALNIIGTGFVLLLSFMQMIAVGRDGMSAAVVIGYVLFAFLSYTLIPLMGSWRQQHKIRTADMVQLAINTLFSCLMMYSAFSMLGLSDYYGLLALIFAVAYSGLGFFTEKKMSAEKGTQAIFYLTGLAFVVLVVPMQFGVQWLTLGWLAEGIMLSLYGVLAGQRRFAKAGIIISALCLGSFVLFDVLAGISGQFVLKYTAITLSSLLLMGAMLYRSHEPASLRNGVKYGAIINLWFYSLYLVFEQLAPRLTLPNYYNSGYLMAALAIAITFGLAAVMPRVPALRDRVIKNIALLQYGLGIVLSLVIHQLASPRLYYVAQQAPTGTALVIANIVLWTFSAVSALALYDLLRGLVLEKQLWVSQLPLFFSSYVVVVFTQNLVNAYGLDFYSAIISILYVVTALGWILFGFARRVTLMRRFGLGLAILSVAKLFLIDLYSMTEGYRIISYFVLGLTLLGISFVYQYFNKRLDLQTEVVAGEKQES